MRTASLVTVLALGLVGCNALKPAALPDAPLTALAPPADSGPGAGDRRPEAAPSPPGDAVGPPAGEAAAAPAETPDAVPGPLVWGLVGIRGYALGDQMAPNGLEFNPLFSIDMNLNLWLWRERGVYGFADTRFWGQKAAPGITNPSQGAFDFSKREFDLEAGVAWNYYGTFEARAFAYSFNNLNRGTSAARPSGYNDGVGLENRWYVGGTYPDLGKPGFDVARASFLSLGFYPSKDMVDADGNLFKPGPFARAYLVYELLGDRWYVYLDAQATGSQSFTPKLLSLDGGTAVRPFSRARRLEFRLGVENKSDLHLRELDTGLYGAVRLVF
jgi:hypothetical protein